MGRKPTPGFRSEAVRIAHTSGLSRRQVAADLGIGFSTLSRWIQQDQRNPEKPSARSELEREVLRLRKKNRLLREERDILKNSHGVLHGEKQMRFAFVEEHRNRVDLPRCPSCAMRWPRRRV